MTIHWQFSIGDLLLWTGLVGLMIFPFAYTSDRWIWPIVIASDAIIIFMVFAARYSEDNIGSEAELEHNNTREFREEPTE